MLSKIIESEKTAYVSPPHGALDIIIIRDANPRVTLALDLGIPNFTVFSMNLPLAEGAPREMSSLIAEAVHVLLDEVASFMLSLEFEEGVITLIYATVLAAFKGMSTEADSSKEQDVSGQDPTVSIYEGTFDIPMDFINETQKRVITGATKIKRDVPVRHIQLTYSPKDKIKPTDTARVIRQYRNRSLRQQPKPLYVIVYDQMGRATGTISIGPGKNFKNELLKHMKKGSIDFTAPVSFVSEQELKSNPLDGIPRAISVGGMTYQPEAMSGGDMALYHGPQDYIVKFPDGRSSIFPGRPTFRKMRTLNFPVPRNRYRWTVIQEEQLETPKSKAPIKETQEAPAEEVKEAASPEQGEFVDAQYDGEDIQGKSLSYAAPAEQSSDDLLRAAIMKQTGKLVYLKPTQTFDDLVSLDTLKKRLERDKLAGKPIMEGLMIIDRIGHFGSFEGKQVIIIPQYYMRRYGVQLNDGTYQVYHKRGDGKAQKVGFHPIKAEEFLQAKPVEDGIE